MTILTATELSELVSDVLSVATIADMTELAKPANMVHINVLGYWDEGDGGGGRFYFDPDDSSTANGGTILAPDAGGVGRWRRVVVGPVTSKMFGCKADGSTNDTTTLQAWLTYIYNSQVDGYLSEGSHKVTDISITLTGNRVTQSLRITGAGRYASRITKISGSNPILTLKSSDTATTATDAGLYLADFGLIGASKGSHGLALTGIAHFDIERLLISGFDSGIPLTSSLVGRIKDCHVADNNIGLITRRTGTNAYCNAITIDGGQYNFNSTRGIDIGQGNMVSLVNDVDCESNGTAADTATGGIIIRNTVDDEVGGAIIRLDSVWLENNLGRSLHVEATTELLLSLHNVNILAPESDRAFLLEGARSLVAKNCYSGGTGDTWDLTCDKALLENCVIDTLTDTGVTSPTYINVGRSAGDFVSGRKSSFTGTLTGCTTSPTGTVSTVLQGKEVTLTFVDILGTSNTTGGTITGMPAALRPSVARAVVGMAQDNGADAPCGFLIGTDGVINFAAFVNFTASGGKGVRACTVKYYL